MTFNPDTASVDELRAECRRIHPAAASVRVHGMFDCHLFCRFKAASVDELIDQAVAFNLRPHMDGDKNLGAVCLCPATVLDANDKEIRRVGRCVLWDCKLHQFNAAELEAWREALMNDPDIPRLLAQSKQEPDNRFNPDTASVTELQAECERRLTCAEKLNNAATLGKWKYRTNLMCSGDLKGAYVFNDDVEIATVSARNVGSQDTCEANAELIASMRNVERARLEYFREEFEECALESRVVGGLTPLMYDSPEDFKEAVQFRVGNLTHRLRRILAALPEVTE